MYEDGLYVDASFPPSSSSVESNTAPLPESSQGKGGVAKWCRPHEIAAKPILFG